MQELESAAQLRSLKLLILVLQENISNTLNPSIPDSPKKALQILENGAKFLNSSKKRHSSSPEEFGKVYASISGDSREYFAVQKINESFIHGCYIISTDEPIFKNVCETSDFDMILNDEKLIANEIDDLMMNPSVDDDIVNDICQCGNVKTKVSMDRPNWGRNRYIERLIDQSREFFISTITCHPTIKITLLGKAM